MDLVKQLVEARPAPEERAEAMRRACAVVAGALAQKAPERLAPETLAALGAGELTTERRSVSPLHGPARGRA